MADPMEIPIPGTPNPNAATFTLNRVVTSHGTTYRDAASAQATWAQQILQISGVVHVFALNTFISVNQHPEAEWNVIGPHVEWILQ